MMKEDTCGCQSRIVSNTGWRRGGHRARAERERERKRGRHRGREAALLGVVDHASDLERIVIRRRGIQPLQDDRHGAVVRPGGGLDGSRDSRSGQGPGSWQTCRRTGPSSLLLAFTRTEVGVTAPDHAEAIGVDHGCASRLEVEADVGAGAPSSDGSRPRARSRRRGAVTARSTPTFQVDSSGPKMPELAGVVNVTVPPPMFDLEISTPFR